MNCGCICLFYEFNALTKTSTIFWMLISSATIRASAPAGARSPDYNEHKRIHDDLTMKTKQLKTAFDQGNNLISIDVMLFLSNWLNTHILEVDKKFGPFLNKKGVH